MATLVAIRPATDSIEETLSVWMTPFVEAATRQSFALIDNVYDYPNGNATRQNVDQALGRNSLVLYCGHGSADGRALGDPPLVDRGNIGTAAGSIVVALACESARVLGPMATRRLGIAAYLGYDRDLPVFDSSAIGDCFGSALYRLAGGSTVGEVLVSLRDDLQPIIDAHRPGGTRQTPDDNLTWLAALALSYGAQVLGRRNVRLV